MQVAEKPGQIQVPDLNQKMKDQKIESCIIKHKITYYSYNHELFSGIAIENF
jgi:hypothetical protein